jgi:integrase
VRYFRDRLVRWYFNGSPSAGTEVSDFDLPKIANVSYCLYQRRNRWQVRINLRGRQIRRSLKTTEEASARTRAIQLVAELSQSAEGRQTIATDVLLADLAAEYIRHIEAEQLAPRTIAKYRWMSKQVLKLAAKMQVTTLSQVDLAFLDAYRLRRQAAGSAPKTIFNETISFKQLLNFAVSRGMIVKSPLKEVKIRKPKPRPQPFWTIDQVRTILAAAAKSPYRNVFLFLAETGMRIGEVIHLSWNDIDLERRVAYVREKQIGKKPTDVWKPKTGRQRVVPLSHEVIEMLRSQPRKDRWVFRRPNNHDPNGTAMRASDRGVLGNLKRVLKSVGLAGHTHTFRHSFISHALMRGVPEAMVREWVGHVDPDTIRHYTHIADEQSHACMDRLFGDHSPQQPSLCVGDSG